MVKHSKCPSSWGAFEKDTQSLSFVGELFFSYSVTDLWHPYGHQVNINLKKERAITVKKQRILQFVIRCIFPSFLITYQLILLHIYTHTLIQRAVSHSFGLRSLICWLTKSGKIPKTLQEYGLNFYPTRHLYKRLGICWALFRDWEVLWKRPHSSTLIQTK